MVFSSTIFLFLFLPIVLGLYYLVPNRAKNLVLLLVSLFFYSWGEDVIVLVMIASTLVDYTCGIIIERGWKKSGLLISILTNLSFLAFFKYFNFTFDNLNYLLQTFGLESSAIQNLPKILLPIGISFYTFQTLSYTIDVYRGKVKANRNIIDFAAYVTMFPQLVAGPIVRYADIQKQLLKKNISAENFSLGVQRFIIGLSKKVLIANTFAAIADGVFDQNVLDISTFYAWMGAISYAFQIYFDFSGYSDMAIGLGKMFGFDFPENFNFPYISKSIREFWRRWHISLSSWFKDYLYISLGGNRVGRIRIYINLLIVFFITGLWHGASWNFVVWGLFHGVFIVIERLGFIKRSKLTSGPLQYAYTLLVVLVGWVIFRADTLNDAVTFIQKMFWFSKGDTAVNSFLDFFHFNVRTLFFMLIAVLFSLPLKFVTKYLQQGKSYETMRFASLFILFSLSIIYIICGTYNPFIYFRF